MYVAKLDRPWVETPFVFQGFQIKDSIEIEQLQSSCEYVYVDIDRGMLSEEQMRSLLSPESEMSLPETRKVDRIAISQGWLSRLLSNVWHKSSSNDTNAVETADSNPYEITSTVRREAPAAKDAYERALSHHKTIVERARRIGEVNLDKAGRAVKPLIESILRNPDAMAWTVFSKKRSA